MSEKLNSGKGFLKEKLGDYQVIPPEKVWDSISSQLGNRSKRNMIILTLSAAASIILAVTLGINFFGPELSEKNGIADNRENVSRESQVEKENAEVRMDQKAESETGRIQIRATEKEMRRDRPEEGVFRTMEEFTDKTTLAASQEPNETDEASVASSGEPDEKEEVSIMAPEETYKDIAKVETTEQMKIPDTQVHEVKLPADPVPELPEKHRRDPRWMIGAALSPLYSFRDAESTAMAGASEFESGTVAYAGGIHVSYRTASRLAIESGIFYNKLGISIGAPGIQLLNESFDLSPLNQVSDQQKITTVTNSVGNIVARSGEVYVNNYKLNAVDEANSFNENRYFEATQADQGIRQHLDYLEFPFNLRYTLVDRTIELQLVGGMSTNFLVDNYVTMETSEGPTEIGYLTNIRSVNYSGNAGLGMIYHIRDQFSLHLEPRFRYFLNSVNDATLPSTRPYTLGIFTGLSYTF